MNQFIAHGSQALSALESPTAPSSVEARRGGWASSGEVARALGVRHVNTNAIHGYKTGWTKRLVQRRPRLCDARFGYAYRALARTEDHSLRALALHRGEPVHRYTDRPLFVTVVGGLELARFSADLGDVLESMAGGFELRWWAKNAHVAPVSQRPSEGEWGIEAADARRGLLDAIVVPACYRSASTLARAEAICAGDGRAVLVSPDSVRPEAIAAAIARALGDA